MGSVHGIQVRAEAWVSEYFYNNTQRGFCETRIINQTLSLRFVGSEPIVFKPGMPFEAQIAVRYHDQVALTQEKLEKSTLLIRATAKLENGQHVDLAEIKVPSKQDQSLSSFADIDRLRHYGQVYGDDARRDKDRVDDINPAAFFTDDAEANAQLLMAVHAREQSFEEYRRTGVHRMRFDVPDKTEELKLVAYFKVMLLICKNMIG